MNPIVLPNELVFEEVEERMRHGEQVVMPFAGRSMEPLLRGGDKIVLVPVCREVRKGDVVLFRYRGCHILHRVVKIRGNQITTQGDSCHTCEKIVRDDVVALLSGVRHPDGTSISTDTAQWRRKSRIALLRKHCRNIAYSCFNRKIRKVLSPIYFVCLAILMWGYFGSLIPLNNFVLGIRLDHLLHASVYIPCTWFLMDWVLKRVSGRMRGFGRLWTLAVLVGVVTETVQYLLPYRGFDVNDLVSNFMGTTLGWLVVRFGRK